MSLWLNKPAFKRLIDEDIQWLLQHAPENLERSHIEGVLRDYADRYEGGGQFRGNGPQRDDA